MSEWCVIAWPEIESVRQRTIGSACATQWHISKINDEAMLPKGAS